MGKAKERKSITQLCVVVDADTGMALHHELDQTSDHELMGLWKTMVGAVAQMGHLPKEDEESSKAWLYGKLFVALLTEGLILRKGRFDVPNPVGRSSFYLQR